MGLIRESMKIKKIFFGIGIHSTRWKHAGFMSLLPYTWSEGQSGLQTVNIPVSLFQIILRMFRIIMNTITMNGAGKLLPVFLPICADWWMPLLVYESFYRNLPVSKYNQTEQTYGPNELHDVAYYNRMKFAKIDEQYDIDSPDDFIWFAKDHYGELGLSFLNIFASDTERLGWVIVVSNSYSANAGLAIEVATALYKSGVPLIIYDADKLLKILEEEDYVRLVPYSYHNYMGYQEEGSVYELPWEYECSEDSGSSLTAEQYKEIVSFAEWQEEERVKVN